jgi:hypothetical protein
MADWSPMSVSSWTPLDPLGACAGAVQGMRSDRWTGACTGAHMRLGWACPNLFFRNALLVQQGMHIAAHTGTEMAVKEACTIGLKKPTVAKGGQR